MTRGFNLSEAEYKVARVEYDRLGEEVWIVVATYADAESAAAACKELHARDSSHDFVSFMDVKMEAKA